VKSRAIGIVLVVLVVLALLVGAAFLWSRGHAREQVVPVALETPTTRNPEAPRAELSQPDANTSNVDAARRETVDSAVSTWHPSECRVLGRVLDARGQAVADAEVAWSFLAKEKSTEPKIVTGSDGRFVITSDRASLGYSSLLVWAGPLSAPAEVRMDEDSTGKPRVLVEGDNDVGDIVLRDRGAVEGRIVGNRGLPLEGVVVTIVTKSDALGLKTATDERGRFVLGGLPAGKIGLQVTAEGWLSPPDVTCTIKLREIARLDDIVLAEAPSISGIVVDESGAVVPDMSLVARSVQSSSAFAKSREDGTFRLWLRTDTPHWIESPPTPDFDSYGRTVREKPKWIEPNTTGVRVVLHRADQVLFRIVDAATRSPIESFSLRVQREEGDKNGGRPSDPPTDHVGGEIRTAAKPGVSYVYVAAPNYARVEAPVTLDAGSTDTQTIALVPGASIRGRVLSGTEAISNVNTNVRREAFGSDGRPVDSSRTTPKGTTYDVPAFSGTFAPQLTTATGHFEFTGLVAGTYALTMTDADGAKTDVRNVRVAQSQVVDVGDVTLVPGAKVRGRLLVPDDESPVGFLVIVDSDTADPASPGFRVDTQRIEANDGSFEIRGLRAGAYSIDWIRPDAAKAPPKRQGASGVRLTLSPGETREIVLDASRSSLCRVDVRVTRAGAPAVGLAVIAALTEGRGSRFLGTTDVDGRVSATIDGDAVFDVTVMGERKTVLARGDAPLRATPRGRVECALELRVGSVALVIPASLAPVSDGSVTIALQSSNGGAATFWLSSPTASFRRDGDLLWTVGVNPLGEVPAGDYDATVTFQQRVGDPAAPKHSRLEALREPFSTRLTIAPGDEARIVVP